MVVRSCLHRWLTRVGLSRVVTVRVVRLRAGLAAGLASVSLL
ncbi:MAG: hypothetical protein RLZZ32_2296, partial [Cyanobacteriota bacterium]